LKAIRSVKEYAEVEYLCEKSIVPVYQYACYISSYEIDAVQLHEIYKQRSTSETWIEQVKGQAMAGATLTDDFWANDILWQLGRANSRVRSTGHLLTGLYHFLQKLPGADIKRN